MQTLTSVKNVLANFAREEDGAQVVEYALVIALVSIGLAVALKTAFTTTPFSAFITRVTNCLSGTGTCA